MEIVAQEVVAADANQRVLRALLSVLMATAALGGAFVYAGGPSAVAGLFPSPSPASGAVQPAPPAKSTTPAATATRSVEASTGAASTTTPAPTSPAIARPTGSRRAQSGLYSEQIASQLAITELAAGRFSQMTLSSPTVVRDKATIRVTARYAGGSSYSGTLGLTRIGGAWYFSYIVRDGNLQRGVWGPAGVDSSVVAVISGQQARYQSVISGLVTGGYRTLKLSAPYGGPGTKTIPCTLSGGSLPARSSSIVMISKVIGPRTYWFIASVR